MAEVEKFTDDSVDMLLRHAERQLKNDANKNIVAEKKNLNYSIKQDSNRLSPREFYSQILGNSYLYGRGTQRESETVTCCSWVVTLPKSVSDYSAVEKHNITVLNPSDEKAFFDGVLQFVSARYGTVFYNRIHYDEGGQPHIHIYFVPQTKLDHDQVHYKTIKAHESTRLESGRYEFKYQFRMENGARIPLKNYAKISDYYDTKISAADVLNKAELQHFHADLAAYLKKYDLPGADGVYTGKTGGKNVAVKALKKFSKETGITVDELKSNPLSKDKLIEIFDKINFKPADRRSIEIINNDAIIEKLQAKIHDLESKPVTADMTKEINHKDAQIKTLSQTIRDKDQILSQLIRHKAELEARLSDVNKELFVKQEALDKAQSRITELEQEKSMNVARQKEAYGWGQNSVSAWGDRSHTGWRTLNVDDEKKW